MAREVRWQVPFMSRDNKKYRVDIYEEGYIWSDVDILKGGANPFYTQEDDDEDAFYPIRTSTGYLTIIVEDMQLIDDILPNNDHDRYVELIDETDANNEVCVWNGFIAPDQYSGTWDKTPFELQLPLLSPLAAARGTRFNPTEKARECYWLIKSIFNYVDAAPTYLWFAKLDDDTPNMVPFLSAILSDSLFLPEESSDELKPRYGSEPLPQLKSKCFSAVDVLEALCRAFGYVLYETPNNYYFSAPDKTNVYRRVEYANVDVNGYDVITLSNHQFPTVAGTDHSRALIPGKSLVRVYCELNVLETLFDLDLSKCKYWDYLYQYPDALDYDPEQCEEILRWEDAYYMDWQYMVGDQEGAPIGGRYNVQRENYVYPDSRRYVGGNWISYRYYEVNGNYPTVPSGFPEEDALIITTRSSGMSGYLQAGAIMTQRKYSAINIERNGLHIYLTANFSKSFRNYKFDDSLSDDSIIIYCSVKWGDYYYQQTLSDTTDPSQPYWATTPQVCPLRLVSNDNKTYEAWKLGGNGAGVAIPPAMINDLQGNISLTFYTFAETQGIKMMRISNLKLGTEHVNTPKGRRGDPHPDLNYPDFLYDYGMLDYRQSLSVFRLSEYAYKQRLTTRGIGWSWSGISVDDPITNTSYEQLLLSRLAQWYDRTIEQLSVTVENEDIQPGVRIVRGNAKYIVLSRTVDWRNGQRILTIQKLYDEPQQ